MAGTNKKFLDLTGTGYLWGKIKTALDAKASASDVSALQALHAEGKTVAQEVSDGITALDLGNTYASKSVVATLIGSDTGKSARTIANEELAAQLIPANAEEALDTLQEIAAWIQEHPGDAATMNAAIEALEDKLELGTYTDGNDNTVEYATVKAYVEAMMATVQASAHGHTNKAVLDDITSALIANWNTAYTNNHTHANASVLAGIAAEDVAAWDQAVTDSHTHDNGTVLDGITAQKVSDWDGAVSALANADTYTAITTTEIDNIVAGGNSGS